MGCVGPHMVGCGGVIVQDGREAVGSVHQKAVFHEEFHYLAEVGVHAQTFLPESEVRQSHSFGRLTQKDTDPKRTVGESQFEFGQ